MHIWGQYFLHNKIMADTYKYLYINILFTSSSSLINLTFDAPFNCSSLICLNEKRRFVLFRPLSIFCSGH